MRIIDLEQRTPEWHDARRGIPTASEFGRIITPAKAQLAAGRESYLCQLIDEVFRPGQADRFGGNDHTERGNCFEAEALEAYAFETDVRLKKVGLILSDDGRMGASPDTLVLAEIDQRRKDMAEHGMAGVDWSLQPSDLYAGGAEVKCPDGPKHLAWMRAGKLPDEHKAQVHGGLLVTGLPWWDFISYCPPYPIFVLRVVPDEFTAKLGECLGQFLAEYAKARKDIEEAIG